MADSSGGQNGGQNGGPTGVPAIPGNSDWSEWTFEQALAALTGEGADLHAAAGQTWLNFNSTPAAGDDVTYHAFGNYYYGINYNTQAVQAWASTYDALNALMGGVAEGKRGDMDIQTLRDLEMAIRMMAVWSDGTAADLHSWSNAMDHDDSAFKGKAAFVIQWRLKANGDGLVDTYQQLTTRHGPAIADTIRDASNGLSTFNWAMAEAWSSVRNLRETVASHLSYEVNNVVEYLKQRGIVVGEPNYYLDSLTTDRAKTYIDQVLREYPLGDLHNADAWAAISKKVSDDVTAILKGWLDPVAQHGMSILQPLYETATSALIQITAPPQEPRPNPNGPNKDGANGQNKDLPPPAGGGGGDLPPPGGGGGGGGDLPPPGANGGGNADAPPPSGGGGGGGGGDLPPPGSGGGGGGDANVPPPPGGGADGGAGGGPNDANSLLSNGANGGADAGGPGLNPPGGDGHIGLNGPHGADSGSPADGGLNSGFPPGFVPPPPTANGGVNKDSAGPGADGAFEESEGNKGVVGPPNSQGGPSSGSLPHGTGRSNTVLPPGADKSWLQPGAPGFQTGDGSSGAHANNGFGVDPGKAAFAGAGAGTGGFGDGLETGGGGPMTSQLSGGPAGQNGASGAPGDGSPNQSGGVPFFPPMMGGGQGGAGGDKPQERERQTWLSEDEEIWGTSVEFRSGAIGRLDDGELELDEAPLMGPLRGQRRADTPQRPRRAKNGTENETKKEAEQEIGTEESSGSASAS
jgi:hypothetical protein